MDLEKAYNKIDNLCCFNNNESKYWQDEYGQWVNFFQGYAQTKDDDFCKNANEMVEALETIKGLVDLQKELGCPLEVLVKALTDGIYYEDTDNYMIYLPVFLDFNLDDKYILYYVDERLLTKDYKKTWWLKEDRSK